MASGVSPSALWALHVDHLCNIRFSKDISLPLL